MPPECRQRACVKYPKGKPPLKWNGPRVVGEKLKTKLDRELDSAWGARGQWDRSADSNNGPGGGPTYGSTETKEAAPRREQSIGQEPEPDNSCEDGGTPSFELVKESQIELKVEIV